MYANLIGLPYQSHGRSFAGVDCFGLIKLAGNDIFDWDMPALLEYDSAMDFKSVNDHIQKQKERFTEVAFEERKEGDIITFKIGGYVCHVGFIIDSRKMLHTLAGHNSAIEDYTRLLWNKRIDGVFRWKGN